jgi:hypothetical protein
MTSKTTSEWLADFPGPITIPSSNRKLYFYLGFSLFIIVWSSLTGYWVWPIIIVPSAAFFVFKMRSGGVALTLDQTGIEQTTLFSKRRFNWKQVDAVRLESAWVGVLAYSPALYIDYCEMIPGQIPFTHQVTISTLYDMKFAELGDLMRAWQKKALETDQSQLVHG